MGHEITVLKNSFAMGECSNRFLGRMDLGKHTKSSLKIENFYITSLGTLKTKPGSLIFDTGGYGDYAKFIVNQLETMTFVYFLYPETILGVLNLSINIFRYNPASSKGLNGKYETGIEKVATINLPGQIETSSAVEKIEAAHLYTVDDWPISVFAGEGVKPFILWHIRNIDDGYNKSPEDPLFVLNLSIDNTSTHWDLDDTDYSDWKAQDFIPKAADGKFLLEGLYNATNMDGWDFYPHHIFTHGSRLGFAGSKMFPQRIWTSNLVQFYYFDTEADNSRSVTDGCFYDITRQESNRIMWISPWDYLIAGTTNGIYVIPHDDIYQATGFDGNYLNVYPRKILNIGSADVKPIQLDGILVFVQSGKKTLRTIVFNQSENSYFAEDVFLFSSHFTEYGIKSLFVKYRDSPVICALCDNGKLIHITYSLEDDDYGATKYTVAQENLKEGIRTEYKISSSSVLYDGTNNIERVLYYSSELKALAIEAPDCSYEFCTRIELPIISAATADITGEFFPTAGNDASMYAALKAWTPFGDFYPKEGSPAEFYVYDLEEKDEVPLLLDITTDILYKADGVTPKEGLTTREFQVIAYKTPILGLRTGAFEGAYFCTLNNYDYYVENITAEVDFTVEESITLNLPYSSLDIGLWIKAEVIPFPIRVEALRMKQITQFFLRSDYAKSFGYQVNREISESKIIPNPASANNEDLSENLVYNVVNSPAYDTKISIFTNAPRPMEILQIGYIVTVNKMSDMAD